MSEERPAGSPAWNDAMYSRHPTPYEKGVAGFIQAKRVSRVLNYAEITLNDRVLEIGCEAGRLCAEVPPCARLVGCDISKEALDDARELLKRGGREAEFLLLDALQPLPFSRGEFDVIICSEMLEHVTDPKQVLLNIANICLPQTRVVLTVPIEAPKVALKQWLQRLGLLHLLFPGIEAGQSEWHLQVFSKPFLLSLTEPNFLYCKLSSVWGCHLVGLLQSQQLHSKPSISRLVEGLAASPIPA